MGKKKSSGFNTPFAGLKQDPPAAPPKPQKPPPPPPPPRDEGGSDEDLFAKAMSGVQRFGDEGIKERVEPPKNLELKGPSDDELALQELERLVSGGGTFEVSDTGDMVSGRAPGVSKRTLQQLEHGEIAFRRHLDLHGLSRDEAKERLNAFIVEARRDNQPCVLVITGRGLGSPQGVPVLREALPRWLSRAPLRAHVLAFATAQRVDGGPGAFYVLLRRPGVKPFGVEG